MNPVFCRKPADTTLFFGPILASFSVLSVVAYFFIDKSGYNFDRPAYYNQTVEMIDSSTGGIATFVQFEIEKQKNQEISIFSKFLQEQKQIEFKSDFTLTFLTQGEIIRKFKITNCDFEMNKRRLLFRSQNFKFDSFSVNVECKTISDPTVVYQIDIKLNSDPFEIRQILLHTIYSVTNGLILILFLFLWKEKLQKARNSLFVICFGLFTHLCGVKSLINDEIFEAVVNHLFRTTCHFFCVSDRSFEFFVLMFIEFLVNCYADLVTPVIKTRKYDYACYLWMLVEIVFVLYKKKSYTEIFIFWILTVNEIASSFIERADDPKYWFVVPILIPSIFGFYYVGKALDSMSQAREHSSQEVLLKESFP
ncbi:hypothetical protein TRFO_40495 [Tritrichomonas foetus]|uniref:Uncharacterized protein n=1 Tax=Tritrichomonas foetus TaxID=1144522 RepID=A0A1J4J6D3_9EUKA|nr:hypothetical protein TRFO_40495 [Tritrichomonas foetus]|eukprot:OHS93227.1 hypothetical protein TRFO_40495 [Tritrichomonas foetus]